MRLPSRSIRRIQSSIALEVVKTRLPTNLTTGIPNRWCQRRAVLWLTPKCCAMDFHDRRVMRDYIPPLTLGVQN